VQQLVFLDLFDDPSPLPAASTAKPGAEPPAPDDAMATQPSSVGSLSVRPPAATPLPSPRPESLADVLAQFAPTRKENRKHRDICTAAHTAAEVLGIRLSDITANPSELAKLLAEAMPAQVGVSPTRWRRVRSLLLVGLVEMGVPLMAGRYVGSRSSAWRTLEAQLPDRRHKIGLSRAIAFFNLEGLDPGDLDEGSFQRFRETLTGASLHRAPEAVYRKTVRLWASAATVSTAWPQCPVTIDADPRRYALDWDDLPETFRADVDAFLHRSGSPDPLSDDWCEPVEESTIALRKKQLTQMSSALILSGVPREDVTSLADLTKVSNARRILRYLLDRKDGKSTPYIAQQAKLLCTVARHWTRSDDLHVLEKLTANVAVKRKRAGLTAKNSARLRQLDHPGNLSALLQLPARTLEDVRRRGDGERRQALRVMNACAVELLLNTALRIGNLTNLELGRHVKAIRRGKTRVWGIVVPGHEVKNDEDYASPIQEAETIALLETYLDTYRDRISPKSGPWLFPNDRGNRRSTIAMSRSIGEYIEREAGLVWNAHLFRHLVGKLVLKENPRDIETVRRVLGHTSSNTTLRNYAELRNDQAFRAYDALIAKLREQRREPVSKRNSNKPRSRK